MAVLGGCVWEELVVWLMVFQAVGLGAWLFSGSVLRDSPECAAQTQVFWGSEECGGLSEGQRHKDRGEGLALCGLRAQDAYSLLSLEQSLDYEEVKADVLRAYKLVPEAYRQKFKRYRKADSQTCVEFAREKESLFDRWCAAQGVKLFEQLCALMIKEELKNCLPERVATYLNEQKVTQVMQAAVLVDEFTLTHTSSSVGKPPLRHNDVTPRRESPDSSVGPLKANTPVSGARQEAWGNKGKVVCHFCKKTVWP
ncbi:hypothetical protein SKAU_G00244600 [Synaphobranchus kaupii]|uniref:SCAN box domain-containing protein n=1 Tax=Synaphobranchus kaupii TaxID=118154 RepID=A0A9Q1F1X9_SYNKA|nr:hypothetical protein SKAU_G00244600 [Synaphobranchus kaupii]